MNQSKEASVSISKFTGREQPLCLDALASFGAY